MTDRKLILLVDDDSERFPTWIESLRDEGFDVQTATTASEALGVVRARVNDLGAVIVDIFVPLGSDFPEPEIRSGRPGLKLARRLRRDFPTLPMIGTSSECETEIVEWFEHHHYPFIWKGRDWPRGIVVALKKILGEIRGPRSFIVHGHDNARVLELKDYLQNRLGWQEPVVLREQSSMGKTVIDKFEHFARDIDLVFVLLTPDDQPMSHDVSNEQKRRARQNVIFELGFFYAHLGRTQGRVCLLHKGPLELPSDLAGVVYVDVSSGILAAGETLRRELAHWA